MQARFLFLIGLVVIAIFGVERQIVRNRSVNNLTSIESLAAPESRSAVAFGESKTVREIIDSTRNLPKNGKFEVREILGHLV